MKTAALRLLSLAVLLAPLGALADPDKDESGHGKRKHGREHKQSYWDGNCKVEIKQKKNGDYQEKRKCKGQQHAYVHAPAPVYVPAPVVVVPAPVSVEPGVVIHGTVRVR